MQSVIASTLLVAFLLCSCNPSVSTRSKSHANKYNGEELFRGIMFADGQVADQIKEVKKVKDFIGLQSFNGKQKAAVKNLQDSLVITIRKLNPRYFESFKFNIQSGNQVLIASTIRNASIVISAILYQNNHALDVIFDNKRNDLFERDMRNSKDFERLQGFPELLPKELREMLESFAKNLHIERDVYINKISHIDVNANTDVNMYTDLFTFLQLHKTNDIQLDPMASVTIEVETAAYAVVAVVAFVVAVAALVVGTPDVFNDVGNLFNEQLVNSIAAEFNVHQVRM